jgi:hypothetical protein
VRRYEKTAGGKIRPPIFTFNILPSRTNAAKPLRKRANRTREIEATTTFLSDKSLKIPAMRELKK